MTATTHQARSATPTIRLNVSYFGPHPAYLPLVIKEHRGQSTCRCAFLGPAGHNRADMPREPAYESVSQARVQL